MVRPRLLDLRCAGRLAVRLIAPQGLSRRRIASTRVMLTWRSMRVSWRRLSAKSVGRAAVWIRDDRAPSRNRFRRAPLPGDPSVLATFATRKLSSGFVRWCNGSTGSPSSKASLR